ncbi:MAG: cysteine desulfurase family protein [Brevinema sp.]
MNPIYLDNNATTMLDPSVKEVMEPFFSSHFGNANSPHLFGTDTHEALDIASNQIYNALNLDDEDTFVVTSGATESINTVHKSILFDFLQQENKKKNKIITTSFEHSASDKSLQFLKSFGIEIIEVPIKDDNIDLDIFKEIFNPDETLLISMIYAQNETGVIVPLHEIANIAQQYKVPIHSDATQCVGKMGLDLQEIPLDYISLSAHKFHGPKGVGGLYIKKNAPLTPLFHGGNQMGGFRAGTLNTAGIVGLGKAIQIATETKEQNIQHIKSLKQKFEEELLAMGAHIYGATQDRLCNTTFMSLPSVDHDYIVWHLNKNQIAAATGSACTSQILSKTKLQRQGVRFSLSKYSSENDIDQTLECLKKLL